jgi:hypothetical protein
MKHVKLFEEHINEMAKPSSSIAKKTFYHGTSKMDAAENILKQGYLKPRDIEWEEQSLTPVAGKVYLTDNLKYATIYSIGGDVMGSKTYKPTSEKGYLFTIKGSELKDIQPDEDFVGEMIYNKEPEWLHDRAKEIIWEVGEWELPQDLLEELELLGYSFWEAVIEGEYIAWAVAGKIVLKELNDEEILELVKIDGNALAHTGKLKRMAAIYLS